MFPHPCGFAFSAAVGKGADPWRVVPDDYFVVRGGTKPMPSAGVVFSCSAGPTLEAAACAVNYGQIRFATAEQIRAAGGSVQWVLERSQRGTLNFQHVHVTERGPTVFSELTANPVPKADRIDGT
jgi:hypothetical protein